MLYHFALMGGLWVIAVVVGLISLFTADDYPKSSLFLIWMSVGLALLGVTQWLIS